MQQQREYMQSKTKYLSRITLGSGLTLTLILAFAAYGRPALADGIGCADYQTQCWNEGMPGFGVCGSYPGGGCSCGTPYGGISPTPLCQAGDDGTDNKSAH